MKMFKISHSKKIAGQYCAAYNCKGSPEEKKLGLCHKHYARKLRIEDPIQVRFSQAKQKAKSRNIVFSITLYQFRKFCKKTGYLSKGKRGQNATIDRICNIHGYHIWNIQLLTNRQNASKGCKSSGDDFECPF
jgi:hypothetical protein